MFREIALNRTFSMLPVSRKEVKLRYLFHLLFNSPSDLKKNEYEIKIKCYENKREHLSICEQMEFPDLCLFLD